MPLTLPSEDFLGAVERAFSLEYPASFRSFCDNPAGAGRYSGLRRGTFVTELPTLEALNRQIGSEEWGDYERIISGQEHPKSGARLWGGLLPFYFDSPKVKRRRNPKLARDIYGFAADEPGSEKVLVWSVHCIVHTFPTFEAWLEEYRK